MPELYIDIIYIILVVPCLLFGAVASFMVKHNFKKYSTVNNASGYTGADTAKKILNDNGIYNVNVVETTGTLTDHYDPKANVIRLSHNVFSGSSVAAVAVAAHEAGHAVQHATAYFPIKVREVVVPVSQFGSYLYLPIIMLGAAIHQEPLINLGILLFATIFFFQLVTLPVEFNASRRALSIIDDGNFLTPEESTGAKQVLTSAALTYVAAMMTSLAQLIRLIILFGSKRKD